MNVYWEGGLFDTTNNQSYLKKIYSWHTTRDYIYKILTARLKLKVPSWFYIKLY